MSFLSIFNDDLQPDLELDDFDMFKPGNSLLGTTSDSKTLQMTLQSIEKHAAADEVQHTPEKLQLSFFSGDEQDFMQKPVARSLFGCSNSTGNLFKEDTDEQFFKGIGDEVANGVNDNEHQENEGEKASKAEDENDTEEANDQPQFQATGTQTSDVDETHDGASEETSQPEAEQETELEAEPEAEPAQWNDSEVSRFADKPFCSVVLQCIQKNRKSPTFEEFRAQCVEEKVPDTLGYDEKENCKQEKVLTEMEKLREEIVCMKEHYMRTAGYAEVRREISDTDGETVCKVAKNDIQVTRELLEMFLPEHRERYTKIRKKMRLLKNNNSAALHRKRKQLYEESMKDVLDFYIGKQSKRQRCMVI